MQESTDETRRAGTRARAAAAVKRGLLGMGLSALVAVSLAACGSSKKESTAAETKSSATQSESASSKPGAGKPPVVIGDKNFEEENILGALYAGALEDKGYNVTLKPNIGSTEVIYKALTSGKIDMYPEYTGVLLSTIAEQTKNPASAKAAYEESKEFVEKEGLTMLEYTPFYDADALATLPAYAKEHKLESIADLKSLGKNVTIGGPAEFQTRFEGLLGLKQEYGVEPTFKPIAIELSYKALESKQVDAQVVFTTDGQLLGGKFKLLSDPKHVFGFQNVAPVISKKTLEEEGPAFEETLNEVTQLLTIEAMQQMNSAVSIDKQPAGEVAKKFLEANGL
ncbi:MAG TPA: glycine betaine ABC transporter substrate-binding protein [Solirubrobacteraceae bacterium]|jgi:osmoprotectant transport system substrate-binding protein